MKKLDSFELKQITGGNDVSPHCAGYKAGQTVRAAIDEILYDLSWQWSAFKNAYL